MALPTATTSSAFNPNSGNLNDAEMKNFRTLQDGVVSQASTAYYDNAYCPISTATTTTVKTGVGELHQVIVLGGTLGAITIYDNTAASGNVIAPVFTPAAAGTYSFDVAFTTGLTIVTGAATAITVTFK